VAPVCNQKGLWGYIDKNGKEVIAFRFGYATPFTDGAAKVLVNSKWLTIDRDGKLSKVEE